MKSSELILTCPKCGKPIFLGDKEESITVMNKFSCDIDLKITCEYCHVKWAIHNHYKCISRNWTFAKKETAQEASIII